MPPKQGLVATATDDNRLPATPWVDPPHARPYGAGRCRTPPQERGAAGDISHPLRNPPTVSVDADDTSTAILEKTAGEAHRWKTTPPRDDGKRRAANTPMNSAEFHEVP
jgi:hypothetical protein